MEQQNSPNNKKNQFAIIAKYSSFGVEMAGGILVPTLIGQKIDKKLGNNDLPIFTLILAAFGLIFVFYRLYQFSK